MVAISMVLGGSVVLLYCATLLTKYVRKNYKPIKGLKGPSGLPFIGNLHQVLGSKPFLTFTDWAHEYGEMFSLQLGSQKAVVINSIEAAREALVTHGKAFAGRPDFYTMSILHENERKFVFARHADDMLKLSRRTILADVRKRMPQLEPIIEKEVEKIDGAIFKQGQNEAVVDMRSVIHKIAANIAHGYAFGHTYELDDPELQKLIVALSQYRELLHWFRMENFLPQAHLFLKGFQEQVANFRSSSMGLYTSRIHNARLVRENGGAGKNGLVDALLDMYDSIKQPSNENDQDIISILRDGMFGGSDGAFQPLIHSLMYTVQNPWLQERIQEEIETVVGSERMPELSDRDSMPYTEAAIREVLRHSEITALGIPRATTEDVTLRDGTMIPKDTLVIVNVYAIHRDSNHWEKPMEFQPERFLDKDGSIKTQSELSYLPFSTGHRACAGQNLARGFLFLLFARFYQKFSVFPAPEEDIPEMINAGGAFNPDMKPFKVKIQKRLCNEALNEE